MDGEFNPSDLNVDGRSDASGENILPEFAYRQHGARLYGLEAQGNWRFYEAPGSPQTLDLQWRADFVRGLNTVTGAGLPRISPLRLGATLVWAQNGANAPAGANATRLGQGWGARLGFDYYAKPVDQSTQAYTFWSAALTYQTLAKITGQESKLLWYARLENATDRLAFSATSILTTSLPGRVPLPGRSFKMGLQILF